ncbi:hypothetical protein [Paraburkholderia susongensis]|uniref:Uncharacterized protein n=1 Tax=Paraburkholderia susongensis TaxID=1515439 RepID=A0A1X7LLT2_9BURK|nr:hypothetical protein [Paraburkholderia susongensis]SMG54811.1 hypothetical protein SAMN06265784_1072 [Paraburkholderia susongensis]
MTTAGKTRTHKVGPYTMNVNQIQPTSENRAPLYAICSPDRWGLRYSDEEKGTLAYPVARDYVKAILQALTTQVQWGEAYFALTGNTPILRLQWPLSDTSSIALFRLINPIISQALTSPTAGFGIPPEAVPTAMGLYMPSSHRSRGEQGAFTPNSWSMFLNASMLEAMFRIKANEVAPVSNGSERNDQLGPLKVFADTLYHEARHCQQWFWIFALVQRHPDNFSAIPNIARWPRSLLDGRQPQSLVIAELTAKQSVPADPAALISLKRMAVGQYLYTQNIWLNTGYYPAFAPNANALNEEVLRTRAVAIDLLQCVGIGGTSVDVDAMVAEPGKCYCDYTSRPWENDAFFCGETASAYWVVDVNPNMALKTYQADQCSRAYENADKDNRLATLLHPRDSNSRTGRPGTDGSQ